MLKRWAVWLRGNRWLAGIAAVMLGLAIAWVLFVPIADWLAHHDVGSVKGSLHETAVDNARGRLLTLAAGLFAAGALAFTARNFTLSREGQVTDRYTKAIEQLGSDKLDVRIGGIYALERVARDSARDHPTVMEVLAAFIREHSRKQWMPPLTDVPGAGRSARPDVQAALTVIGRRDTKRDIRRIDLSRTDLSGANLYDADLSGTLLVGTTFTGADLVGARFVGAILLGAHLDGPDLMRASFADAVLKRAHLDGATLAYADLSRADLSGADLTDAILNDADLTRADLTRADLTGANLSHARWPEDTPVPEGWTLDPSSGRLERASTGPRQMEAD